MHDEDALDRQLFEAGDIAALLARYEPVIRGRSIAAFRGRPEWEDVAQNVRLRLLREFRRRPVYPYKAPYRVVVGMVIGWTIKDYFEGRPADVPLPEGWDGATEGDETQEILSRDWLAWLFGDLPERERQVAEATYLRGLERDQVADDLGIDRNNVYQRLNSLHNRLREGGGFG
jgi:RNA polymerase sigma factor (sigma-70 family)